jgi:hypothetical protein
LSEFLYTTELVELAGVEQCHVPRDETFQCLRIVGNELRRRIEPLRRRDLSHFAEKPSPYGLAPEAAAVDDGLAFAAPAAPGGRYRVRIDAILNFPPKVQNQ